MIKQALLGGIVLLMTAGASSAYAATGAGLEPAAAAPGERVTFDNGCVGVVDSPPASVAVAFVVDGGAIVSAPRGLALATAPFFFAFTVPALASGTYTVVLECAPGNWDTNLAEPTGPARLTVIGTPATDTLAAPSNGDGRVVAVIGLAALGGGLATAAFGARRPAARRRSPGR